MKRLILVLLCAVPLGAQTIALREVVTGLDSPVAITHAGDARLFITSQKGYVFIHDGTQLLTTPFIDLHTIVSCCGERGLLSVAFHPQYASNGFFFVDYTDPTGDINIVRYKVSGNPNVADAGSATPILTINHRDYSNHNGGQLAFGPDGFLYAGTGDGGGGGDPLQNGQNPTSRLGKILRIDVDHGSPYAVQNWAMGMRNPWRFSFDRDTGDLIIGDVGQGSWEEIDFQLSTSTGGENYGWNIMEGFHCYNAATCNQTGLTLPVLEYSHANSACSVTGGYRYRGSRSTQFFGTYFYGDYCNGVIYGATRNANGTWSATQVYDAAFSITTFGEGFDKELYVADYSTGRILHIEDPLAPSISSIAPGSGRSNGGESVTITGTNLSNPASVTFGGVAASITASSATSITVTTPSAPALGNVSVVVTNAAGQGITTFRYDLGVPLSVIATASGSSSVSINWSSVPGASGYEVLRNDGATFTTAGTSTTDNAAGANTAHTYRVRAAGGTYSTPDLATTVLFTDDPLIAGMTVKAVHLTQLRTAVDAVRTLAGLTNTPYTDATITAHATPIRAVHLTELRTRLDQARSTLGLSAMSYTNPLTTVRSVQFTEVRNGVK